MQASTSPAGAAAGMKIYEVLRTLRERLREAETHLAESSKRLEDLEERVDELRSLRLETRALGEAIEAGRAATQEEAAGLANRLGDLAAALEDLAGRLAIVEDLPERVSILESRDVAAELGPRLAAAESAMADALDSLRTQIEEQMTQLRSQTDERIQSLSSETEEQVERFSTHTADRFETLGLETGARVERFEAEIEARIEQAQAAVERARREWAAAVGGLDERLSDEREALVQTTERLGQVEADMSGLQAAHDAIVEEMRLASEANVRDVRESIEGIRDRLESVDEVESRAQRALNEAQDAARMAITPSDAAGIRHELELTRASLAAREADVASLRVRVEELAARPPGGWRPQRVMAALLVLAAVGIVAGIVVGRVTGGGGEFALPQECQQLQELVIKDFKLSDKAARTYAKALADALAGQKDDAAAAAGPAADVFEDFQTNNSELQAKIDACQARLTETRGG